MGSWVVVEPGEVGLAWEVAEARLRPPALEQVFELPHELACSRPELARQGRKVDEQRHATACGGYYGVTVRSGNSYPEELTERSRGRLVQAGQLSQEHPSLRMVYQIDKGFAVSPGQGTMGLPLSSCTGRTQVLEPLGQSDP
jgi:hypothetical protein